MATSVTLLQAAETADGLGALGKVEVKKFFGGAGLVLNGVYFAFFMKGTLYLRTDESTRTRFEALALAPFSYATKTGRVTVTAYHEAPADAMEDSQTLLTWARDAYAAAVRSRKAPAIRAVKPKRARRAAS
ncbi:TfoX/Sxy family protein [Polaromonas sp.]|uniref:TfoX/Sxy family protein n=1 Tax=Polaromonas sp. TaxID=1869339 RepID=UPI003266AB14